MNKTRPRIILSIGEYGVNNERYYWQYAFMGELLDGGDAPSWDEAYRTARVAFAAVERKAEHEWSLRNDEDQ